MPADATAPMPADTPDAGGRTPTENELAKESSVLFPLLAEFGTTTMLLGFGLLTASLTLLSEGIRSILMLSASIYAFIVMRSMHRGGLNRFEFGVGKIEQFVSALVGLGLAMSGLWVARSVIDTLFSSGGTATPLGLASAAVVNAINTVINWLGWYGMKVASRQGDSEVFRAQLRARLTMMTSSLFLQGTLTVAALARDSQIALLLDAAGATFVAGLMLYNGLNMMGRSLPDLLDAPPPGGARRADPPRCGAHRTASGTGADPHSPLRLHGLRRGAGAG